MPEAKKSLPEPFPKSRASSVTCFSFSGNMSSLPNNLYCIILLFVYQGKAFHLKNP